MIESTTTCRIIDPNDSLGGTISVRVDFTRELLSSTFNIAGVFRLSDDSEIDFTTLDRDTQDTILDACQKEIAE